jgi:hypothetical protein
MHRFFINILKNHVNMSIDIGSAFMAFKCICQFLHANYLSTIVKGTSPCPSETQFQVSTVQVDRMFGSYQE